MTLIYFGRLDQGLNEFYACPTCRKPLFVGRSEVEANPHNAEVLSDVQLARQISSGLDRQNTPGNILPTGVSPNPTQNATNGSPWRFTSLLLFIDVVFYRLPWI